MAALHAAARPEAAPYLAVASARRPYHWRRLARTLALPQRARGPKGNRQCLNWQLATLAIGNITTLATLPRGYLRRAAWAAARRAIGTRNGEQLT